MGRALGRPEVTAERPTLTVADLEAWQDSGATWRALSVGEQDAVVELCTCTGEPVDVLSGRGEDLVAFIRAVGESGACSE